MIHDRMLECYGDAVKGLTLERASLGELRDRFRVYSIDGETLRKALAFFVHAAEYSGVTLSSHITRKARLAKKTDGNRKRPRSTKMRMQETESVSGSPIQNPPQRYELHPSLQGLLADLARHGDKWSREERDRWLKTFASNVEYAYPGREARSETRQT